ncbi:MAG: 5-bromo-4-chloroindolyl phosphate hydrolysis family protein [Hyphomonadaceae bacterium]|nr:5-bromo-4-chloroindolyl phosphate hydrolysis family protein [Hyphomonadaceae bacterium]
MASREDWPVLAGGAAALVMLPVAVLVLGAPLWAGLGLALAAFAGCAVWPAAQAVLHGGEAAAPRSALEAVQVEAEPALARLTAAAVKIARPSAREHVLAIAQAGAAVLEEVRANPVELGLVQRLLTYYLPSAAQIAASYAALETDGLAAPERLEGVEALLERLAVAARRYAQVLVDAELQALQAEIDLVEVALRDDLGASPETRRIP